MGPSERMTLSPTYFRTGPGKATGESLASASPLEVPLSEGESHVPEWHPVDCKMTNQPTNFRRLRGPV